MVFYVLVGLVVLAGAFWGTTDLVGFEHLDRISLLLFKDLRLSFDVPFFSGVILWRLDLFFDDGLALFLFLFDFEDDDRSENRQDDDVKSGRDCPVRCIG